MKEKRYKIATLGCRTNQYESEAYRNGLEKLGYREAKPGEGADVAIVNTCTVTESADQKSRYQIRQLVRENPDGRIFVTGCFAERAKDELLGMGVAGVVPNSDKENLLQHIFPDIENLPEFVIERFAAHTRAFVKVQDGCNSYCSYCILPFVRGRSRSKPIDTIVREIEALIANGYIEIVLTGINIGDFEAEGKRLADLVKIVDQMEGLKRLRISSIDPDEVDDDLLSAVIDGKRTCHSMHIVLQSGSNAILKRMNRKYTRQEFYHAIGRLRDASSDFTFTTDIIVGFPGEGEGEFQETLEVMEEVRFAKVHMFPYSERPKTRSARFTDKVPQVVMNERRDKVQRFSEKIAFDLRQTYVGRTMKVLLESNSSGHTDNFLEVFIDGEKNQIIDVELIENTALGLVGKAL